jgi:hypothetical protein
MTKTKGAKMKKQATISNCQFTGVHYDAKAVEAINTIATGLVENAKALGKLAEVLKASNITIESLVKIDAGT